MGITGAIAKTQKMRVNDRATYLVFAIGSGAVAVGAVAVYAGLCHLVEPAALRFGVNLSGLTHWIEPYRPLFLFGTAGLLFLGFGLTYLPPGNHLEDNNPMRVGTPGQRALWAGVAMYVLALLIPPIVALLVA